MTLVEFLRARIAEDEETARTGFSHPDRWVRVAPGIPTGLSCTAVLAECEARRKILELADEAEVTDIAAKMEGGLSTDPDHDAPLVGERIMRAMALPYADHPDWREEWRP